MATIVHIDASDLQRLERLFRGAPREAVRAVAMVANSMAFETRRRAVSGGIAKDMTVRTPSLLRAALRVAKAVPKTQPEAELGSVARPRFSGWVEQYGLGQDERKAFPQVVSRTGKSRKRTVASRYRMSRGKRFRRPSDIGAPTQGARIMRFLSQLAREKVNDPFVLDEGTKQPHGLYRMTGAVRGGRRRMILLQSFDGGGKRRARRKHFLERSLPSQRWLEQTWERAIHRSFKLLGKHV